MFDEMSKKKPDFCTAILQNLQLETVVFEQNLFMSSKQVGTFDKTTEYSCNFVAMGEKPEGSYVKKYKENFTFSSPYFHYMINCSIWPDGVDNMIYYFLNNLMEYDTSKNQRNEYISSFLKNLSNPDHLDLNQLPNVFFFFQDPKLNDNEFFLNTFAKIFFTVFITIINFYITLKTYMFNNSKELAKSDQQFYNKILKSLDFIVIKKKKISWNDCYRYYMTIYKEITTNKACAKIFEDDINNINDVSFRSIELLNRNSIGIYSIDNDKCQVVIRMDINKTNLKTMIHSLSSKTELYLKNEPLTVSVGHSAKELIVKDNSYHSAITFDQFLDYLRTYHNRNVYEKNSENESLTKVNQFLKNHFGIRNVSRLPVYRKFKFNIIEGNFEHAVFNFFQFWFVENNEKTGEYFLDEFYNDWSYVRNSILFLIELIKKSKNFEDSKMIFQDENFSYILNKMGCPRQISDLKSFFKKKIEPRHKEVKCKWSFSYVSQPYIDRQEVKPQLHFFLFIAKCLNQNPLQYLSGFEYIPEVT